MNKEYRLAGAVEGGAAIATGAFIERRVIPHVHPLVFTAVSMAVDVPEPTGAIGAIETFSASSIIEVAVAAGCGVAAAEGILVGRAVIAAPRYELFRKMV
jgi:microcompartment protein CcmL/EutN